MVYTALNSTAKTGFATAKYLFVCISFLLTVFLQHNSTFFQDQIVKPISLITEYSDEAYDLPTFLNIRSFVDYTWSDDGQITETRAARAAASRPFSLVAFYRSIPNSCARKPYKPYLLRALDRFRTRKGVLGVRGEVIVRRKETLLVHIQASATNMNGSLSDNFMKSVLNLATRFHSVILMPTFEDEGSRAQSKADVSYLSQMISGEGKTILIHESEGQDEDLYLMHAASNLLVHRGSFSALGALVCDGTVYHTAELNEYMQQDQFKWLVKEAKPAMDTYRHRASLAGMGPVLPTCCAFKAFGVGGGKKIVCANAIAFSQEPCWVLSLGCNGKWSFEISIVHKTNCEVHTFDCTGTWDVPEEIKERVTLHKLCLGQEHDRRKYYIGWNRIIELGSSLSGSGVRKMPALAKMDIGGQEFPVLQSLVVDGIESMLPEQLALELHSRTNNPVGAPFLLESPRSRTTMVTEEIISDLFKNLSTRGYRLVHRADNPLCSYCSEVTIVREAGLPPTESH